MVERIPETFKAYLAGLTDGEGYIGLVKRNDESCRLGFAFRQHVSIGLAKAEDLLKEAKEAFGGFILTKKSPNGKLYPRLTMEGAPARKFLKAIYPYLRVKREQAKLVLEFTNYMRWGGGANTEEKLLKQIEIYNKVKLLNSSKGHFLQLVKVDGVPKVIEYSERNWHRKDISKEDLIKYYVKQKLGTEQVGEILGCSPDTVRRRLKVFNIPIRGSRKAS
jgi:hypothetical protein